MIRPVTMAFAGSIPQLASAAVTPEFMEQDMLRFVDSKRGRPDLTGEIDFNSAETALIVIGILNRSVPTMQFSRLAKMFDYYNDFDDSCGGGFYGLIKPPAGFEQQLVPLRFQLARRLLKDQHEGLDPTNESFLRLCIRTVASTAQDTNWKLTKSFNDESLVLPEYVLQSYIREIEALLQRSS